MNYQFLANTRLFRGISVDELEKMLTCFSVQTRQYEKGSLILRAGQTVSAIGLVLSGNITIENNDLWGNRTVMDRLGAGAIFAESYALTPEEILMVDIVANEPADRSPFLTAPGYPKSLSGVLLQPPRPLRQSACHFLTKEPAYVPPHPPHLAQDHPRQALVLSVFFCTKRGQLRVRASPLTANNWQIIWGSTAAPLQRTQQDAA